MQPLAFLERVLGQRVQAPGGIGGECVDLINLYLIEVWVRPAIRANAVDWPKQRIAGMTWVANAPLNAPTVGDFVVFGPYAKEGIGLNGHIAMALIADTMRLLTADQNWPEGAPVSVVLHDYDAVLGWFTLGGSGAGGA